MNIQMKNSGIEWLGEIPAHWDVKRIKYLAEFGKEKLSQLPDGSRYIGLENIESWSGRLQLEPTRQEIDGSVNLFSTGDILFGKLRPYLAKVTLADFDGACTTEIIPIRPQPEIVAGFMTYCMLNVSFIEYVSGMTYGAKMPRVGPDQLADIRLPVPTVAEQRAIADYLDTETTRIDTLIEKKRRLINLLTERRQAIITQAVTKGLDPTVPTKHSRVEWLGEIPAHWEVKRLKHLATIRVSNVDKHVVDGQPVVRLVNYTDVYYNDLITPDMQLMVSTTDRDKLSKFSVLVGDTIITKDSETPDDIGVPAYVEEAGSDMVCGYHLAILRPVTKRTLPKFIFYATKSSSSAAYWSSMASGLTRYGLKIDSIGSCAVAIPPLPEQRAIVDHLDTETQRIDTLVSKLERQISLLTERRQAVITAAVTGKLDISDPSLIKAKPQNL